MLDTEWLSLGFCNSLKKIVASKYSVISFKNILIKILLSNGLKQF